MLKVEQQALVQDKLTTIRSIYDKHAGMLLGYIFEVVKDRELAEEYVVRIFNELSKRFDELNWEDMNTWCALLRFAKNVLAEYRMTVRDCDAPSASGLVLHHSRHQNFNDLNDEQKKVFCDVYYNGKGIAEISKELRKTEDLIRKTLKEAFAIMRKSD